MVAGHGFQHGAAVGRDVGRAFGEVGPHAGDGRFRRGEPDALVRSIETAAHQRHVIPPPPVVAARDFDGESFFVHIIIKCDRISSAKIRKRLTDAKPNCTRFGAKRADALNLAVFFANVLFFRNFAH